MPGPITFGFGYGLGTVDAFSSRMCAHATRVFAVLHAVWPLRSLSARSRSPLLRSPNQRRIWRQLVRVVIACLSISPVRRRGRGLRSVHGELRRAYRAFITCWQTETGLLLPTGMLPAPYGLALPQSAHFVAVAISADIAVVSSR